MKITLNVEQQDGQKETGIGRGCQRGHRKPYGRGSYLRTLCELAVETGFWPHQIPFDTQELHTMLDVLKQRAKEAKRGR